jgi:CubicO group peptidase (beta-lactamase class C family)
MSPKESDSDANDGAQHCRRQALAARANTAQVSRQSINQEIEMKEKKVCIRRHYVAAACAAALVQLPVSAQTFTPQKADALDAFIKSALTTAKVPGATVAVVVNNQIVFERAYGVRDTGTGVAVNTTTQFPIASISKPVTAMMMATVADSGNVGWDTKAQTVLPSFRVASAAASSKITIRNLFCNCTGVPRQDFEYIYRATKLTPNDIIAQTAKYSTDATFGQRFLYNNQMVATGGWIAAAAAAGNTNNLEDSYNQQIESRVLVPIGMNNTTPSQSAVWSRGNYATSHPYDFTYTSIPQQRDGERALDAISPAGGLWSTAGDLARFAITHLRRGIAPNNQRVVSAANLTETWKPQVSVSSTTQYGLGLYILSSNGRRVLLHDGNGLGVTSEMTFLPDHNVAVVVLSNRGSTQFNAYVRTKALREIFDETSTELSANLFAAVTTEKNNLAATLNQLVEIPPAEQQKLIGIWTHPILGRVQISAAGLLVRYNAESFTNRLAKFVQNGVTYYVFRDEQWLGGYTAVPTANGLSVFHISGTQQYDFKR